MSFKKMKNMVEPDLNIRAVLKQARQHLKNSEEFDNNQQTSISIKEIDNIITSLESHKKMPYRPDFKTRSEQISVQQDELSKSLNMLKKRIYNKKNITSQKSLHECKAIEYLNPKMPNADASKMLMEKQKTSKRNQMNNRIKALNKDVILITDDKNLDKVRNEKECTVLYLNPTHGKMQEEQSCTLPKRSISNEVVNATNEQSDTDEAVDQVFNISKSKDNVSDAELPTPRGSMLSGRIPNYSNTNNYNGEDRNQLKARCGTYSLERMWQQRMAAGKTKETKNALQLNSKDIQQKHNLLNMLKAHKQNKDDADLPKVSRQFLERHFPLKPNSCQAMECKQLKTSKHNRKDCKALSAKNSAAHGELCKQKTATDNNETLNKLLTNICNSKRNLEQQYGTL